MNIHNVWAIKLSNQNEKQFTECYFTMEKTILIYLRLKMLVIRNTRLVDVFDGEKSRSSVSVLLKKGKKNKEKRTKLNGKNFSSEHKIHQCFHHTNMYTLSKSQNKRANPKKFTTYSSTNSFHKKREQLADFSSFLDST